MALGGCHLKSHIDKKADFLNCNVRGNHVLFDKNILQY